MLLRNGNQMKIICNHVKPEAGNFIPGTKKINKYLSDTYTMLTIANSFTVQTSNLTPLIVELKTSYKHSFLNRPGSEGTGDRCTATLPANEIFFLANERS